MEYKKKLGHLNLPELALALDTNLEHLLNEITQKKELHIRDIPVIITYGDLCIIQGIIHCAASTLNDIQKQVYNVEQMKKASDSVGELLSLFKYIDTVLMDGNISKEAIKRIDPSIDIPK